MLLSFVLFSESRQGPCFSSGCRLMPISGGGQRGTALVERPLDRRLRAPKLGLYQLGYGLRSPVPLMRAGTTYVSSGSAHWVGCGDLRATARGTSCYRGFSFCSPPDSVDNVISRRPSCRGLGGTPFRVSAELADGVIGIVCRAHSPDVLTNVLTVNPICAVLGSAHETHWSTWSTSRRRPPSLSAVFPL